MLKMTTSVSGIHTWASYFAAHKLTPRTPAPEDTFQVDHILNEKISLWKGDITKIEADAIVNAAKPSLLGGGGVDEAIHSAAGPQLLQECSTLGGCKVGQAKITKGYNLPARYVIHTVGTTTQDRSELAACYKHAYSLLLKHSLRSIVFPCVSTGIYGFEPNAAAHTALYETRRFLLQHHENVDRIVFCVFQDEDERIYEDLLRKYFPVWVKDRNFTY